METLAFSLSSLGTVCVCCSTLLKGKNMKLILFLVFLTNSLLATSYILTGAFNGAVSCCIGAAQTLINFLFQRKNKAIPRWLIAVYAIAFTIANVLVFSRITDAIALLASLAFIMGICQKNGKMYRVWTLANTGLWIAYDFISFSYGPLSTHIILFVTIVLGMILHDRKKA